MAVAGLDTLRVDGVLMKEKLDQAGYVLKALLMKSVC